MTARRPKATPSPKTKTVRRSRRRPAGPNARSEVVVAKRHTMDYIRLLTNPCTGPLVHGIGSSEGGSVVRFESDFIIGNGASDTAGVYSITPGAINASTSANGLGSLVGVGASDVAALTLSSGGASTYVPGLFFLQSQASSYRCIAACVQLYWPGSELNRSGVVSAAQGTYGLASTAASGPSTGAYRSICPVVERMPTNFMEVKWAPNYADGLFRNPSSTTVPEDGHSSILLTWSGIPVSTGVRIRVVCVYEWRPKAVGLVLGSNVGTSSAASIQSVRHLLDEKDATWWYKTGQAALNFASGVTVAYLARRGGSYPQLRNEL